MEIMCACVFSVASVILYVPLRTHRGFCRRDRGAFLKKFRNLVVFPPTAKQNEFTVLKQPLTKSALHREKTDTQNRMYIKRKRKGDRNRKERGKREQQARQPNHAITLCLITAWDVRPSMKHVYYNDHPYHNTMHASTHSAYHFREWEHFSRKMEFQIFPSWDHSAVQYVC